MKVIFLDIDGVLNSEETAERGIHIDNEKVLLLRRIVEVTGANVVISSTWRIRHSIKFFKELFWCTGFGYHDSNIIDVTPRDADVMYNNVPHGHRGTEINQWLKEMPGVEKYIILDDDSDFTDEQKEKYLIQTSWKTGLLKEHVNKAIELLKDT